MAGERTAKSTYPSRYGKSRFVTAAQWLAELMCERRARAEKRQLPCEFWKDPHWGAEYRKQVVAANRLIKRLDPAGTGSGAAAVSAFLRSDQGRAAYSLAGAWIVPHAEAFHKRVAAPAAAGDGHDAPGRTDLPAGGRPALASSAASALEGI